MVKDLTTAIHGAPRSDSSSKPITHPLILSTTFEQPSIDNIQAYSYTRQNNPTRNTLEQLFSKLETAQHTISFSSGCAALDAVLKLLRPGDHWLAAPHVYGGTWRSLDWFSKHYNIKGTWSKPEDFINNITKKTRLVIIETPTNPILNVIDIKEIAALTKKYGSWLVVDNTFATPYLQKPLLHGADIVLHSTTKYMGGHSDILGGAVMTNNDEIEKEIRFTQNATGAVPSPFDCWLMLRSLKTLPLRMKQHCSNAEKVAAFFAEKLGEDKTYYPGLPSKEGYAVMKSQAIGFGGIVSIDLGSQKRAQKFIHASKLFRCAESLGGMASLVTHPAKMTHASIPSSEQKKIGITEGLLRLNVGCEDVDDILHDLEQAYLVSCAGDSR